MQRFVKSPSPLFPHWRSSAWCSLRYLCSLCWLSWVFESAIWVKLSFTFRRCVPCFRPRLSPPSSAFVYVPFVYPDFINHTPRAPLHDKRVFRCRWQDSHFSSLISQAIAANRKYRRYRWLHRDCAKVLPCASTKIFFWSGVFQNAFNAPLLFLGDCIVRSGYPRTDSISIDGKGDEICNLNEARSIHVHLILSDCLWRNYWLNGIKPKQSHLFICLSSC